MASLSVQALRSQFETMATNNVTRPQPFNDHNTSGSNYIDIDSWTNEPYNDDMDDDVFSSYGDGDNATETTTADESLESGRSTPEHYVEIATTNPYSKECRDSAEQTGKYMDSTSTDTDIVNVTLDTPVRTETMEEALSRLSRELELAHREIEEDQAAVLRHIMVPSN